MPKINRRGLDPQVSNLRFAQVMSLAQSSWEVNAPTHAAGEKHKVMREAHSQAEPRGTGAPVR